MLNEALNRLQGQVYIRAECPFPERVLNLCGARDLAFWDLVWESPTTFTCRLSRRDYRLLRHAAGQIDCDLRVVRQEGAPYFFARFRHRQILLIALIICTTALFLGSFFIWDFEVTGNTTVPEEKILRALEQQDVSLGTFGLSLNAEEIRNHVLLAIPELSWITVNVSGCRAKVQVVERVKAPELIDERTPASVIARRDGLILEVRATDGVAVVEPGTAVTTGEQLISGLEELETQVPIGTRMMAGQGSVRARTWYTLTTTVPMTVSEKHYTGHEKTALSLVFGKRRIKFFSDSSIMGKEYDKIMERRPWSFLGVPLPVTAVLEKFRFYETVSTECSLAQAQRRTETALRQQLAATVTPYGEIRSALCASRQRGDLLDVTLTAECVEEIGVSVPLFT